MNADEIVALLMEARDAYYNSGNPVMSDEEFDRLEDHLRSVDPGNPYFVSVGIISTGVKIRHDVPMLSMAKGKNIDDITTWMRRLALEGAVYVIEPKIDGLSATCRYRDGKLIYVATRGDGETGQDISHVAEYIRDIPGNVVFTKEDVEVRGELYLPRNTPFNTGGRPLRNNCVGLINRKENRGDLKFVRFAAYQIIGMDKPVSESERIALLGGEGFKAVEYFTVSDTGEIESIYNEYTGRLRGEWEYETDGLIISVDDRRLFDEIDSRWVLDRHHHYAIALKPPAEYRETVLRNVIWQVSRQGNLIPVALFEPVVLGGARLERATLHNYENVIRLMVEKGDTLIVQRANDVIPFIHSNKSSVARVKFNPELVAKRCPSCAFEPARSGVHLKCLNPECREQIIQKIIYWVKNCGIENVAEATVRTLYDLGKIAGIKSLYELTPDDFTGIEGFADKKISNFISEVKRSKRMSAVEFISRLGIPLVQKKSLVRMGISGISEFIDFDDDTYVIGRNIIEWKRDESNMKLFGELADVLEITDEEKTASLGAVCMTGKGPGKRNGLIKIIEDMGYEYSSTVTRNLSILICDDPAGKSTKLENARKNGIRLMSYGEFFGDRLSEKAE